MTFNDFEVGILFKYNRGKLFRYKNSPVIAAIISDID